MSSITYRPEIDGLRAIAVMAVVLFHAEFSLNDGNLLQGGYLGVDVFFVISGYLITSIILKDIHSESFTFSNFYERRARRILPTLFTIMCISIPLAWYLMLPKSMKEYAGSALSSLAFGSNFWFFSEDSYWAEPGLFKPLLHTWSLSVEEQFYILFPAFLLITLRFLNQHILRVLILCFIVSLLFSEYSSHYAPEAGFYLLPSRGWELIAGAILSKLEIDGKRRLVNKTSSTLMPIIGLILIVVSMILFDKETSHPSWLTLFPIIGTMFLIWFCNGKDIIGKLLSSKPIVALGLVSYGFYLWHFQIFSFARIGDVFSSNFQKIGWIVLSLLLSITTYYIIEKPTRSRVRISRKNLVYLLSSLFVFLSTIFTIGYVSDGANFRFKSFEQQVDIDYWNESKGNRDKFQTYPGCWLGKKTYNEDEPFRLCRQGENLQIRKEIMVIGDSHAAGLIPGLIEYFGRDSIAQRVIGACCPYVDDETSLTEKKTKICSSGLEEAIADIELLKPDLIIFSGNYKEPEHAEFYRHQFTGSLKKYKDRILIVGPLPKWGKSIVRRLTDLYNKAPNEFIIPTRLPVSSQTFKVEQAFKQVADDLGIQYLSPVQTFCENKMCLTKTGSTPDSITSWDSSHLTDKASNYLINHNLSLLKSFLQDE